MLAPTPTIDTLIRDFYEIVYQVGSIIIDYATKKQTPLHYSRYGQQARNMMASQAWVRRRNHAGNSGTDTRHQQNKRKTRRHPLVEVATSAEHTAEWGPEVYDYLTKVYGQDRKNPTS